MNQSELAFGLPVIIIGQDAALTVASSQLHCISTYSTNRSTLATFHPDSTDVYRFVCMHLTLCQRTATLELENVVEATAVGPGLPPGGTRAAPNVQH